jgi:hypothetical protein
MFGCFLLVGAVGKWNDDLGIAVVLAVIGLAITIRYGRLWVKGYECYEWNRKESPQLMKNWENSFLCSRCGKISINEK